MEEIFDTYDRDKNFLGTKPRSFCHGDNPGCYHKTVWVWIINKARGKECFLLQKRSMKKRNGPGKWDMPSAGHVASGEKLLEACVRETKEELGIDTKEEDYKLLTDWICDEDWELAWIYMLETDKEIQDLTLQNDEVERVQYFDFESMEKLIYSDDFFPHSKRYRDWAVKTLKNC